VKHAGPAALTQLEQLLSELRRLPQLTEKSPGTFYVKSRAFLHFHEDPEGLFADVRLDDDFVRYRVTTRDEQQALVRMIATSPG
jgi:hypothetical protein